MVPLVSLLCFSLAAMGCLFWVDNEWVYIKGGGADDAGRAKLFDLLLADGLDHDEIKALGPDGDGVIPLAVGYLIKRGKLQALPGDHKSLTIPGK